jgi:hypothetical protein
LWLGLVHAGLPSVRQKIYQLAKSSCNNRQQDKVGTYTQPAKSANRTGSITCTVASVAPKGALSGKLDGSEWGTAPRGAE